ncbi:MAG: magnesium transporter [Spirochaetota bacterium]|nr:magnesium transporter [Spirochaetota bacterium]
MKNPIFIPELRDLLKKKKYQILKSFLEDHHEKENAEFLGLLEPDEIWKILNLVDIYKRAEIFSYLDMDVQVSMVSTELKKNVTELLMQMSHDDRADLFQHLEKDVVDKLLLLLPPKERRDILQLTSYCEGSTGAIMTTDYATLYENDVVEIAIKKLRRVAPSKETIYYIYVTDEQNRLIGFVSLRKIIIARPKQKIKDIMKKDVISIYVDDDQERAAKIIEEYDLIALPVVDHNEKLAGIITHDDAIDIIREEETEDLEKLMAISGGVEEKSYLDLPAYIHFRKRIYWVIILGVLGLFAGIILKVFQGSLEKLILLTFYIPLLNSAGGNTGTQAASVVLRAIILNELFPKDIMKVVKKELVISVLICLCLGSVVYIGVMLFSSGQDIPSGFKLQNIAALISLALSIQVIWSTLFGAVIPIFATKLKLDPAVISSPALTTLVDMGGITIYFTTAKLLLDI